MNKYVAYYLFNNVKHYYDCFPLWTINIENATLFDNIEQTNALKKIYPKAIIEEVAVTYEVGYYQNNQFVILAVHSTEENAKITLGKFTIPNCLIKRVITQMTKQYVVTTNCNNLKWYLDNAEHWVPDIKDAAIYRSLEQANAIKEIHAYAEIEEYNPTRTNPLVCG